MRGAALPGRAVTRASAASAVVVAVLLLLLTGCGGSSESSFRGADRATPQSGPGVEKLWTFDEEPAGGLPDGAQVFSGTWEIRPEPDAPTEPNALCQTGEAEFPALVLGDAAYTDVALSASFKPISGREDQAAGLIFRVEDEGNYYILRANALEDNVDVYKYSGGERGELASEPAEVEAGEWQELRVEAVGGEIRGFLDDELVVAAKDDEFPAGRVGLWTKADSKTCFDRVLSATP
ncbi:MAG: DUF1080 domain-containing protein [Actinomycetota bacterium]|nr:DUF1080 domain-containing protein [Actinomycetota bacterium]